MDSTTYRKIKNGYVEYDEARKDDEIVLDLTPRVGWHPRILSLTLKQARQLYKELGEVLEEIDKV